MLLHGIFTPITTPFYPEGNVYYKKLEANVERYSRTPSSGIVVQGSTGEAILLSDQGRSDVPKTAITAPPPNKSSIPGADAAPQTPPRRPPDWPATARLARR